MGQDMAKGKDKHVWCWSCGGKTMQPTGNYFTCINCDATYADTPKLSKAASGVAIYETK